MALRHKILAIVLLTVAVAVSAFALVLSHDSPCAPPPQAENDTVTIKAVVYRCYGSPEVVRVENIGKPTPHDDEVLVRVRAASVNPLDWHYLRGSPYIMRLGSGIGRPITPRLGVDFSGTVEAVGRDVTRFRPGDAVYGGRTGAFAEYVTVKADHAVVPKPANVTFEQAAAVPVAAVTALQGLRDKGRIKAGEKVLINGASGGVGTFAVQIARSFGAEVTGVCSTRNLGLVRSIGAQHVIDYTAEDFTQDLERYDLILDNVGNRPLSALRRVLRPGGRLVIVGGPPGDWIGPLINPLKAMLMAPFVSEELIFFVADLKPDDLEFLNGLMEAGKLMPVIDRQFRLDEVPEAIAYSEEGHARGKIIVVPDSP